MPQGCYALPRGRCDLATRAASGELAENTKCLWALAQTAFSGLGAPPCLDNTNLHPIASYFMKNHPIVQDAFCSLSEETCKVSENQSKVSVKEDSELIDNHEPTSRFDRITFGERVRSLRSERDFSQEDLARLIFLSPSQLSRVESGLKKNISIELVEALAMALGVTVVVLLGWS